MQMRSAEEAQIPAMDQEPPLSLQEDTDASRAPSGETPTDEIAAGAVADQDTTVIPAPDDPFAGSGVTLQPYRAQTPQALQAQDYATPQLPARAELDPVEATTLTFTPNTAAGVSYLFLWVSGVLIFFNERRNTYVRFHALQSILFGATATIAGVVGVVAAVLLADLGSAWHASILTAVGLLCALLIPFTIVVVWWWLIVAAWTGHDVALPILGRYAKHYAAPEGQSLNAPHA